MKLENITTQFINSQEIPLVVTSKAKQEANPQALIEFLDNHHEWLTAQLQKYGCILFRGYNLASAEDFSDTVKACGLGKFMSYAGGTSPRKQLADGVYTSTEAPPHSQIPLHNEMSYSPLFPKHLYFYCHNPAQKGGATPIANARKIYTELDPKIRNKFEKEGVLYKRFFYEKYFLFYLLNKMNCLFLPWTRSFETTDRSVVEKKLKTNGFDFNWLPKQKGLTTSIKLPAFREHPITGEKVWFNQMITFNDYDNIYQYAVLGKSFAWIFKYLLLTKNNLPMTTAFGTGKPIPKAIIKHLISVVQNNLVIFPWQKGDFLVIDNYLCMHGREPFQGNRTIMASLTL
jgi:alpha-ketoglutarate-dependent taurine dioxygenase